MGPAEWMFRARTRAVWSDPARKIRTLERFSQTELDGAEDLRRAARRVTDGDLREHIVRHSQDEQRHGELFRRRAAELRAETGLEARGASEPDRVLDLAFFREREGRGAHGFLSPKRLDELGEVTYVAMLHVAERRADRMFRVFKEQLDGDAKTREVFAEILRDEAYHVAYTRTFLERWKRDGRRDEVRSALSAARGSRLLDGWKRAGIRSAAGFGRVLLWLLFATVLAPFGMLARRQRVESGLVDAQPREADDLLGQY